MALQITPIRKITPKILKLTALLATGFIVVLGVLYFTRPASADSINSTDFVTTWKTDNISTGSSCDSCVTIPIGGGGYSYNVDWNNDGIADQTGLTGSVTHDFGTPGTYKIRISGAFPRIFFSGVGDVEKLLEINQWGAIEWQTMSYAFMSVRNLTIPATDAPDLSNVSDMSYMFTYTHALNQPINHWNVSSVENFASMFYGSTAFNQPLNSWDMSSATNIDQMFTTAGAFDQSVADWDISTVETADGLFNFSGLTTANYDAIINSWAQQSVQDGIELGSYRSYCSSSIARQSLIVNHNWNLSTDSIACKILINGQSRFKTDTVAINTPVGILGMDSPSLFTPRTVDPYAIACTHPGVDDNLFSIGGVFNRQLIALQGIDKDNPVDANSDGVYEVCIQATNATGGITEQRVTINEAYGIQEASFTNDGDHIVLTLNGAGFLNSPMEWIEGTERSFVTLDGVALPFCAEPFGDTAAGVSEMYSVDPSLVTDDPPCYIFLDASFSPGVTGTSAIVWLPLDFNLNGGSIISVNGTPDFTLGGSEGGNTSIDPTLNVNAPKPIDQQPTIPKMPSFSGVASPWSVITVTVQSDPVTCQAISEANGGWSCTLPNDLPPGTHTVTMVVSEADGTQRTLGPYTVFVGENGSGGMIIGVPNTGIAPLPTMTIVTILTGFIALLVFGLHAIRK